MERLQKKQAALRQAIDRIVTVASTLLLEPSVPSGELEEQFDLLVEQSEELKSVNDNIEKKMDLQELDAELAAAAAYSEKIRVTKTRIKRALRNEKPSEDRSSIPSVTGGISEHSVDAGATAGQVPSTTTKLPKLEIAKFSGDLRSWQRFWNQFEATIHKNGALSPIEKFQYLTSYLTGKAAAAVEGLPLSNQNYEVAVKTLTERFGKEDVIIEEHMSRLLGVRPVHNVLDIERLRTLYDEIQSGVRGLEALGVTSNAYGVLLLTVLRKSIPNELCLEYFRKKATAATVPQDDLQDFLDFLRTEVESRERARGTAHQPRSTDAKLKGPSLKEKVPSTAVFSIKGTESQCAFCGAESHVAADCMASVPLDMKREIMTKERRCYKCAKKNHRAAQCRTVKWLKCGKCSSRHATGVCELNKKLTPPHSRDDSAPSQAIVQSSLQVAKANEMPRVLLQTAQAWAETKQRRALVRILLDGGSQRTFVRQEISRRLKLRVVGEERLAIHTFGTTKASFKTCRRVELWLRSRHSDNRIRLEALEVPEISGDFLPPPDVSSASLAEEQGLQLADVTAEGDRPDTGISLLIGADHYWDVTTGDVKRINDKLVAAETILGWTLQGTMSRATATTCVTATGVMRVLVTTEQDSDDVSKQLRSFWELEHLGIVDTESTEKEDDVLRDFQESVTYKDGRYQVALPWKGNATDLADNKDTAVQRLRSLTRKLMRNDDVMEAYDQALRDYLVAGHAEEVDDSGESPKGPIYYMPHRGVVRPASQTTKLRVVFDASSSAPGQLSLNDVLFAGPNLNPNLSDILIRFRTHRIAIMADIEKAFLQVQLSESDRDALRFLWYERAPKQSEELPPIKEYRMTRVPFGATSSPFLLAATLRHHIGSLQDRYPSTSRVLQNDLYVDDLVTGADTVEEAERICEESQAIMEKAGMHLRKWRSNATELTMVLSEGESAQGSFPEVAKTKILGVEWRPSTDDFVFEMNTLIDFLRTRQDTKRFLLQASARIFDPFGFLAPISITAKLVFQTLWERGTDWDERLPPDVLDRWDSWCQQLPELRRISVPRRLALKGEHAEPELHIFCDASPKAYGAVAYVKTRDEDGNFTVALLMAKSRVAPLKRLSLPRLELMGTLIGARLAKTLVQQLNVRAISVHCWSDSTVALSWIRSSALRWKPFVANRVQEIQSLTDPSVWRHCPGKENPGDLLTRGIMPSSLVGNETWWSGPEWLRTTGICPIDPAEIDTKACAVEERAVQVLNTVTSSAPEPLLNLENSSSLNRVLRVTAWIKRFLYNSRNPSNKLQGELTAVELGGAEKYWIWSSQAQSFSKEVTALRSSIALDKRSPILALNPFLDADGVLRVGGRLQHSAEEEETKHPAIISSAHRFAFLLITREHKRLLHAGVRDILSHLRERYWVLRARQVARSVIRRCIPCQRQSCRPAAEPVAPLPPERVTRADPFQVTGVDFAGPLFYSDRGTTRKGYVTLFTCAVTRAVHLELVSDLTSNSFLMAFKRFVSRRGISKVVYSDNALTFKRASKDLAKMFRAARGTEVQAYLGENGISWKFIVERAAWWGGFWERMVRTVKACLRKSLGRSCLDFDNLRTVLTEVEAVVNSRPLTYVNSDAGEPEPLSPAHFLVGRRLTSLPSTSATTSTESTRETLRRKWKHRATLVDLFWRRWRREYLLELRSAHLTKPTQQRSVKKGDLVLLGDARVSRQMWPMGRVVETFPGRDGNVRACRIAFPNKRELRRPVQALFPLELDNNAAQ